MLHVELNHILTEEDALQKIREIFDHVENSKETYVITKDGRPAFALVDINQLEQGASAGISLTSSAPEPPAAPEAPAPQAPAAPTPTTSQPPTLPPLGDLTLPDLPEDPSNSSPLA